MHQVKVRSGRFASAVASAAVLLGAGCSRTDPGRSFLATANPDQAAPGLVIPDTDRPRPPGTDVRLPDPGAPGYPRRDVLVTGSAQFLAGSKPRTSLRGGQPDRKFTLNLVNVQVQEAAKEVLGDIAAVNYTVDPRIENRISVQTSRESTRAEAIDLFLAALRTVGVVVIQNGSVYRVAVADQQASTTARFGANPGSGNPEQLGSGSRYLQIQHVSAAELRRVLEPMSATGASIQVDESRNTLIVTGTPSEIASIEETVALFDVSMMKGMSFALVPIAVADPEAIVEDLQKIFTSGRESAMSGMVQFIPNKRLKTILIISRQASYLKEARQWVKRYEIQATGPERQYYTYSLKNRQARELAEILGSMFSREASSQEANGRSGSGPGVAPRFRQTTLESLAASPNSSGLRQTVDPSGGGSTGGASGGVFDQNRGAAAARGGSSPEPGPPTIATSQDRNLQGEARIKIVADDANNSLLILASQEDYDRVLKVIANLDIAPNQVLIEATIAEVSLNDNLKYGVRWLFQGGNSSATFTGALDGAINSVFPGFSYVLKGPQVTLNALNNIAKVNVISSPSLMVLDNHQAVLQIGDQVPTTTQTSAGTVLPGQPVINSITYKDTGVVLSITPRISDSGRVLLDIEQEVSSVSRTTSSNIDSPTIGRRRVKTTVIANNGEPITLGGMIQDKVSRASAQIPVLGSIPLLGNAFRDKSNQTEKTELIIVITARVARNMAEARAATQEYRDKINELWRRGKSPAKDFRRSVRQLIE